MNWLDRSIAFFAPRAGVARARARAAIAVAARQYEGAKGGRRQSGWNRPGTSANAEIYGAASQLRASAREVVRNNPYGKKAVRIYAASLVGTGIVPQPNTGNKRRDKVIAAAFADWSEQCDAAGQLDFYGLQALIARTRFESGEVIVRYRDRLPGDGLGPVPMQLQVLEPDFIDTSKYSVSGAPTGALAGRVAIVNQGIAFDKLGRRVGYYLWSQHPGESIFIPKSLNSTLVPADQVAHIYRIDRPGQIRGVTDFDAVLQKMYDLDEYSDAELMRKKIEACLAAFVTQADGTDGAPLGAAAQDTATPANRLEALEPGMIEYLKPGESVTFGAPAASGDFPGFNSEQLHAIATGLGVTYEELTNDLRGVNYSSLRAGMLPFRRQIEMDQWLMMVAMYLRPTWRRFIDRLFIAGVIDKPYYGVTWTPPKWDQVDPMKDTDAVVRKIRAGLTSPQEAIRAAGFDPEQILADLIAWNKSLDDAGIILDSDPRKTNARGSAIPPDDVPGDPGNAAPGKTPAKKAPAIVPQPAKPASKGK